MGLRNPAYRDLSAVFLKFGLIAFEDKMHFNCQSHKISPSLWKILSHLFLLSAGAPQDSFLLVLVFFCLSLILCKQGYCSVDKFISVQNEISAFLLS